MKRLFTTTMLFAAAGLTGTAAAAPIAVTGLNTDIVVDAGNAQYDTVTTGGIVAGQDWTLVEAGYTGTGSGNLTGTGLSIVADTVTTQKGTVFAVDADVNNALLNDGTLTLVSPDKYQDLQFLLFVSSGTATVTLNFADASTTQFVSPSFADWQGATEDNAFAVSGGSDEINSIKRVSGGTITLNPREFGITLAPADQAKTLNSITFDFSSDHRASVMAVSGSLVPEPSSLALLGLGGLLIARRRRA